MKFDLFCSCGAVMKGFATPDSKAKKFIAIWNTVHTGKGHIPVDAKKAGYARRKAEKEAAIAYSIDNYVDLED